MYGISTKCRCIYHTWMVWVSVVHLTVTTSSCLPVGRSKGSFRWQTVKAKPTKFPPRKNPPRCRNVVSRLWTASCLPKRRGKLALKHIYIYCDYIMFIYLYACIRKHLPVSLLSWPKMSPRTVTDGYHLWTTWKNVSNFFWKFWGWKWWWKIFYRTKSPSCRRFGPRLDTGSEKNTATDATKHRRNLKIWVIHQGLAAIFWPNLQPLSFSADFWEQIYTKTNKKGRCSWVYLLPWFPKTSFLHVASAWCNSLHGVKIIYLEPGTWVDFGNHFLDIKIGGCIIQVKQPIKSGCLEFQV